MCSASGYKERAESNNGWAPGTVTTWWWQEVPFWQSDPHTVIINLCPSKVLPVNPLRVSLTSNMSPIYIQLGAATIHSIMYNHFHHAHLLVTIKNNFLYISFTLILYDVSYVSLYPVSGHFSFRYCASFWSYHPCVFVCERDTWVLTIYWRPHNIKSHTYAPSSVLSWTDWRKS